MQDSPSVGKHPPSSFSPRLVAASVTRLNKTAQLFLSNTVDVFPVMTPSSTGGAMKMRDSVMDGSEVFGVPCSEMASVMIYSGCADVRLNGESYIILSILYGEVAFADALNCEIDIEERFGDCV